MLWPTRLLLFRSIHRKRRFFFLSGHACRYTWQLSAPYSSFWSTIACNISLVVDFLCSCATSCSNRIRTLKNGNFQLWRHRDSTLVPLLSSIFLWACDRTSCRRLALSRTLTLWKRKLSILGELWLRGLWLTCFVCFRGWEGVCLIHWKIWLGMSKWLVIWCVRSCCTTF